MVSVIEKFLIVLGLEKGLDSESTFEVVRHFTKGVEEKKIVLFDSRISLDDQNIKLVNLNLI